MRSAGLLPFRRSADGELEVFIAHMGGPFWARKDARAWSIVKGEVEAGEDERVAAAREFAEEIGCPAPTGPWRDLGEIRQKGGKVVRAFTVCAPSSRSWPAIRSRWSGRAARGDRFASARSIARNG